MICTNSVLIAGLVINIILLQCCCHYSLAYTQVAIDGSGVSGNGDGPKIYKAVNFDLIFPKSFNSSENVISTTPESIPSPSKTAVIGKPFYSLSQVNEAKTYNRETEPSLPAAATMGQPTLYVTPPPPVEIEDTVAASNEAGIYERQQTTNGNNYSYNNRLTPQVVTQNPINIQQQQQPSYEQQQQLNVNNKAKVQQQQQKNLATGRAVDYQSGYPFGQLITPLIKNTPEPVAFRKLITSYTSFPSPSPSSSSSSSSNVGKIIYPQGMYHRKRLSQAEIDKLSGKGSFRDRFSPSEGVASFNFKNNHDHTHGHDHNHNHNPNRVPGTSTNGKTSAALNAINTFVAPNNLYSFPPNNINYPSLPPGKVNSYTAPASGPIQDNNYKKNKVNSYAPPPSGPLMNANFNLDAASSNNSPYQYNGPVSTSYLPPSSVGGDGKTNDDVKVSDGGGDGDTDSGPADDSIGVLPASAMDQGNDMVNSVNSDMAGNDMIGGSDMSHTMDEQDAKTNDDNSYDTEKEYPTPPPGWLKEHPESAHVHHDHDHDHDHDYHHPDIIFDHDHFHHSYPSYPIYPSYPHIIYDDHEHDHLPEIEHHPPAATTTEAPPPPEPKPEPRVKKYSYFYIGRKLWYIPLYFTVWFSFYVLWLILKSIARHKVQLPNHYTGDLPNKYVNRRSLDSYDFSQVKQKTINDLTVSVLDKIDKFKRKYLNN